MDHKIPENLKYTQEHEWIKQDGELVLVGITDFAQSSLGDIVYIELPHKGTIVEKGESFGVVESIKSVSDLYAPVSGEIIENNSPLVDGPDKVNQSPYESWLIKIKPSNKSELNALLNSQSYKEHCNNL